MFASATAWLLGSAAVLVVLAGLIAMAEAALSAYSRARAEELAREERRGSAALQRVAADPVPALNTALLLRMAAEICAVVLVAVACEEYFEPWWLTLLVAAGVMLVVSYVVVGVAPRTIGRQHADGVALAFAGPLLSLTRVLGPVARLLILLGNALTPGKGFREGPFATEAELREMVDLAEAGRIIESGEREMIHSVFELGDTVVREVMVPRTDVVFIESGKTLRQFQSLALRSGFSRIPAVGPGGLDDIVGVVYLKDVARRLYDNRDAESVERVGTVTRPAFFVPDSKPADDLLREMQAQRTHVAVVVDEYGGTAGLVTIEDILEEIVGEITDEYDTDEADVQELENGAVRVSSRLHIDDLGDLFGIELSDDDVDTVGGLMAKQLGRVPIPGAEVDVAGLHLIAEEPEGRRNRIGTIRASRIVRIEDTHPHEEHA
ncbi:CBS domain containing-hemolysin-like protein [Haloactinopolyspora alba]|uniref:CBS domain containing-hemolysin-like protein n=1 Tax=Haloactinopolyspora alba TaxID=648780 RepID=A0A2P8EBV5_9ACTN|nr:hemolysin family protein [Haloactinopolyspora alba]PSL06934.1 CBS domain containing-hemolysin-like protein [Haloactinopolyspora alba]